MVLVALLALQAQYAVRSHRQAAEAVLQDYARLAADEFTRRLTADVGYNGYYPLVTLLAKEAEGQGLLPSPERLASDADPKVRGAAELPRTFFRRRESGSLELAGEPLGPGVEAWLRGGLAVIEGKTMDGQPFRALHGIPGDEPHSAIYALVGGSGAGGRQVIVGFDVRLPALRPWFERAMERGPLLPASLSRSDLANDVVSVSLREAAGREVFRRGDPASNPLSVESRIGDSYGGIFEGMSVLAALDPAAAPQLVIGGLPRSRLPALLGLLALTAGLVGASIYLIRRERALSALRSEFIARVSHELRTPLTQIRMFAETLLLERVRSEEERRRSLEIMDREARRLSHLVENILQFSRGERGRIRLAPQAVRIAPLAREIADAFRPLARSRGSRVLTDLDDGPVAHLDGDAMRQILLNLLDNALKYGPAGQEIRLSLTSTPTTARLSVEDQGPGIPERDRERVWGRFQRLERDEKGAVAGTGIGLTVVRDLVSLHGGEVWVESGANGGARFVVELPLQEGAG